MTAPYILTAMRDGCPESTEPKECCKCGCRIDERQEDWYMVDHELYCENCLLEKFRVW